MALYLIDRRFVTSIKKKIFDSPTRCATDGVVQPRSYDDTVTYKHKIQIKKMFKIINISKDNFYASLICLLMRYLTIISYLPKKIFTRIKF